MTDSRPNTVITAMSVVHPIEAFTVPSEAVLQSGYRLEGSYYGSDGYRAALSLFRSGFKLDELGTHAIVRWFGPFSRTYVNDAARGIAFLSSSEIMEAKLEPEKYISVSLTRDLQRLLVKEGMILVSCSGTIGNVALCTKDFDGMAVSQHAIRVIPRDRTDLGVHYAFLQCQAGQFLIKRNKSGSVIESIYEADVAGLLLPLLPKNLRIRLSELVSDVGRLRVDANALLDEASAGLRIHGDLPDLQQSADHEDSFWCKTFTMPSTEIEQGDEARSYHRLDAAYYDPIVQRLRRKIVETGRFVTVAQASSEVILIPKTFVEGVHKVEKEYGIGYFTGKELLRTRLIPDVFITSAKRALIDRLVVQQSTILVTCAGTIGRVMYVSGNLEGMTVTHDAIRVCPNGSIAPGFLFAFLSSQYGQLQLRRCSYGSVIPRLYKTHVEQIVVPYPRDGGAAVGELVDRAFENRRLAAKIEAEAISLFETAVEEGKGITEEKWGTEY